MWGLWIAAALAAPRLVLPAGEDPAGWTEVAAAAGLVFEPGLDGTVELLGGRRGWEVVAHLGAASARDAVAAPTDAAARAAALARGVALLEGLKAGEAPPMAAAGETTPDVEAGEGRGAWSEAALGLALRPGAGATGTLAVRVGAGGARAGLGVGVGAALPEAARSLGEGGRLLEVDAGVVGRLRLAAGGAGELGGELWLGGALRRASVGAGDRDLDVVPLLAPSLAYSRPAGDAAWLCLRLRPELALLPGGFELGEAPGALAPLRVVVELGAGARTR